MKQFLAITASLALAASGCKAPSDDPSEGAPCAARASIADILAVTTYRSAVFRGELDGELPMASCSTVELEFRPCFQDLVPACGVWAKLPTPDELVSQPLSGFTQVCLDTGIAFTASLTAGDFVAEIHGSLDEPDPWRATEVEVRISLGGTFYDGALDMVDRLAATSASDLCSTTGSSGGGMR